MSRRVSLADLVPEPVSAIADTEPVSAIAEVPVIPEVPVAAVPARKRKPRPPAEPPTPERPKYLRLDRVEARLYPDQTETLDAIARRLNRARQSRGHRITANDLLRVAVDLLLTREVDLAGYTEADLMAAVGLAPRE